MFARNPEFGGPAGPRQRWKLANRRPLLHGELSCPCSSDRRFPSSLRRRAVAGPPTVRFSTTGANMMCRTKERARPALGACATRPGHAVNMMTRHPDAAKTVDAESRRRAAATMGWGIQFIFCATRYLLKICRMTPPERVRGGRAADYASCTVPCHPPFEMEQAVGCSKYICVPVSRASTQTKRDTDRRTSHAKAACRRAALRPAGTRAAAAARP